MPVDHEVRRGELSRAVVRLVADRGLDAVSVRTVAAAAGVSIGAVQHYFPTKDAMLLHAQSVVNAEVGARAEAAVEGVDGAREALRAIVLAVLPTDEESARIIRVFTAFETRALHSRVLAERSRRDDRELHTVVEHLLRLGGVRQSRLEAVALIALMGGLCQQLLLHGPHRLAADAVQVVDRHLARVFDTEGTE